jgi:hypothetical protein
MAKERKPWKLNNLITSTIRKLWSRSPLKAEALQLALTNPEDKKYKHLYRCSMCGEAFPITQVEVDHIDDGLPVETWDQFISRMFCGVESVFWIGGVPLHSGHGGLLQDIVKENLRVLCKECHAERTKLQRAVARAKKKGK